MKFLGNTVPTSLANTYRRNLFLQKFAGVLGVDILVKASAFLLIPLYLRLMSQDEFGLYNYLLSIVQTFSLVLNFGLYIPQSKLYHTYHTEKERGRLLFTIAATLFLALLVILLPLILFGWDANLIGLLFKNSQSYRSYRVVVLAALPITIASFILTNFFYTSEKIRQVKTYNLYRVIFVNILALSTLFILKSDPVQIRLGVSYAVEVVLFIFFAHSYLKEWVPQFDWRLMKNSLKMGLPVMLSALFGIVINFSDKFFLERFGSLKDLSNYYLAFSFASIIPLIFTSLQNVWFPQFLKEQDLGKNIQNSKKLSKKMVILFAGLALCIWLLFCCLLWKGIIPHKYNQAALILPLLLVTQIIVSLATLFNNYLVYFEKTQFISYAGLFVSLISLTLGMWLIPQWGVYGAAVSSLLANTVYLVIYYYLSLTFKKKYFERLAVQQ
ncbi:lipopolysaccharide biosynthesis protein [Flavisolibacter nicotianae]|uniref:lipopolysaccharide biosynthesis protein n=1 Tax=Flavisolibacter nicotianae TaxID=2364882 RepID=UPI000EB2C98F|nr:oligosaccharide flippase family protein [Flavisolibacter nicotianae]